MVSKDIVQLVSIALHCMAKARLEPTAHAFALHLLLLL
jgi:hypothetical protein